MNILTDEKLCGMTVREVLQRELKYSSNMIKKLKFSEGGILVNGSFVTVRYELKMGDVLSLAVEDKAEDVSPYTIPSPIPIDVIYEDEYLTAVNKPHAMPSHPSLGHKDDTVSNALAYRYRDRNYVFRPVNRLDRDTSGCMLSANSKAASYRLYKAMVDGEIRKYYIAVTDSCPQEDEGTLHSYLKREEGSIIKRAVTDSSDPDGKEAITTFKVVYRGEDHGVLLLSPVTGRTHQIRLQLAHIGCPVTGDDMYGKASGLISRQALHSYVTFVPHPETEKVLQLKAPIREDMLSLIRTVFKNFDEVLSLIDGAI